MAISRQLSEDWKENQLLICRRHWNCGAVAKSKRGFDLLGLADDRHYVVHLRPTACECTGSQAETPYQPASSVLPSVSDEVQCNLGSKLGAIKAERLAVKEEIALRRKDQPRGEWPLRLLWRSAHLRIEFLPHDRSASSLWTSTYLFYTTGGVR